MDCRYALIVIVLTAAVEVHAQEEVHCESSTGHCIVTGYYDYDPKKIEVNLLVENRTVDKFTTTLRLPNGRTRRQTWSVGSTTNACRTTKQCENGATLECYASAPCGGGETGDTLWCGQYIADSENATHSLAGAVHLCHPLTDDDPPPGDPGDPDQADPTPPEGAGGQGDPKQPPPVPKGAPPQGNPPGGGASSSCSGTRFRTLNLAEDRPYILQIEERTPKRNKTFTVLGPGGYRSLMTITHDGSVVDVVNTVEAPKKTELRHFRIQDRQSLMQLADVGWVQLPATYSRSMMGPMAQANPGMYARRVDWDDYIGRTRCPRNRVDNEANECLVFRNATQDLFYVHKQSCMLEHVDMTNDNGPVAVEVFWLRDNFQFDHVEPIRSMSASPFEDADLYEKMNEGDGAVDHDFHQTRDFKSRGMSIR